MWGRGKGALDLAPPVPQANYPSLLTPDDGSEAGPFPAAFSLLTDAFLFRSSLLQGPLTPAGHTASLGHPSHCTDHSGWPHVASGLRPAAECGWHLVPGCLCRLNKHIISSFWAFSPSHAFLTPIRVLFAGGGLTKKKPLSLSCWNPQSLHLYPWLEVLMKSRGSHGIELMAPGARPWAGLWHFLAHLVLPVTRREGID